MFLALNMFYTNKKLGETTNRMLNLDLKKKNRYQNSERESSQIK
jgi:hypothetical protein